MARSSPSTVERQSCRQNQPAISKQLTSRSSNATFNTSFCNRACGSQLSMRERGLRRGIEREGQRGMYTLLDKCQPGAGSIKWRIVTATSAFKLDLKLPLFILGHELAGAKLSRLGHSPGFCCHAMHLLPRACHRRTCTD